MEIKLDMTVIAQDRIEIAKRLAYFAQGLMLEGRTDHDDVTPEGTRCGGGVTKWKFGVEP